MECTGTDAHEATTRYHSSSTVVTGVWELVNYSSIMDQTFSIGDISGECDGQNNSRTFFISRNVRTIPEICGSSLSCLNVGVRTARIKFKSNGT
ncbi:hypothetical protein TNCV_1447221 [Trichonephila clavipes]|nr:hypothetical protein TNCV_1447221 [Trichonephila clavipes]